METKQCTCCKEIKPLSEFNKDKTKKDGLVSRCRSCVSKRMKVYHDANKDKARAYREKNKDKITERNKAYKEANREQSHWQQIKQRALKKRLAFDLTVEDVSNYDTCPVFGWKLERGLGKQRNSPSIDRIDPKGGYTKDNIQIMSDKANTMKQDATPEELLMFADWIIKTYRK
jgi:hypothetical protein